MISPSILFLDIDGVLNSLNYLRYGSRGDEIQAWLDSHIKMGIEINTFAILEDEENMGFLESRTVRTNFSDGLTESHAERVIRLLE